MEVRYFTDENKIEENAKRSIESMDPDGNIDQVAVFPDIHFCSERSIPVGIAFSTTDVFYPLITGKDMGCGVAYLRFLKSDLTTPFDKEKHFRAFEREVHQMTDEGLGGGNHFLSLEESNNWFYIIVHTGSRNLGIQMYQENYALIQEYNPGKDWLPMSFATDVYIEKHESILMYAEQRRNEFLQKSYAFLLKNKYLEKYVNYGQADSCHNLLEFKNGHAIHRKGSTQLNGNPIVIPISMLRGSLIVQENRFHPDLERSLHSSSHGAGRELSRTDTLKHWHSLKKQKRDEYKKRFSELLNRSGEFDSSILQEFDFAYKSSDSILKDQPYLKLVDETRPIVTVKFTGV